MYILPWSLKLINAYCPFSVSWGSGGHMFGWQLTKGIFAHQYTLFSDFQRKINSIEVKMQIKDVGF